MDLVFARINSVFNNQALFWDHSDNMHTFTLTWSKCAACSGNKTRISMTSCEYPPAAGRAKERRDVQWAPGELWQLDEHPAEGGHLHLQGGCVGLVVREPVLPGQNDNADENEMGKLNQHIAYLCSRVVRLIQDECWLAGFHPVLVCVYGGRTGEGTGGGERREASPPNCQFPSFLPLQICILSQLRTNSPLKPTSSHLRESIK